MFSLHKDILRRVFFLVSLSNAEKKSEFNYVSACMFILIQYSKSLIKKNPKCADKNVSPCLEQCTKNVSLQDIYDMYDFEWYTTLDIFFSCCDLGRSTEIIVRVL